MKRIPTLTIGIPAYNEAENIAHLLTRLLKDRSRTYHLDTIIVSSDGSTDDTTRLVRTFAGRGVQLIHTRNRNGAAYAQNRIIARASSDYLLLLNADIKIEDPDFIAKLLAQFSTSPDVGLVSACVTPLSATTFVEKVINWSHEVKTHMYQKNPDSLYLCHGRVRMFSKKLYTSFVFPKIIAEDAYSYLRAKTLKFGFSYAKHTCVYFRSPTTLRDHFLQSQRFALGKRELTAYFNRDTLRQAYRLPLRGAFKLWLAAAASQPLYAVAYLAILFASSITMRTQTRYLHAAWKPSESSKKL